MTNKKTQPRRGLDIGKGLLYLAAMMQATQYASAAHLANGSGGTLDFGVFLIPISQVGGFFAGLVINFSLAYSATRLPRIKSPKAQAWAKAAFYALLSISPLLIGPANYATMDKSMLGGNMILQALWAVGWASMMDIAIALVGFVDKDLIALSVPTASQSAVSAEGSAPSASAVRAHKNRSADVVRPHCAALSAQYACTEPQCGWSPSVDALITSVQAGKNAKNSASSAKAGHMKNKHPKPIAIDQSLLIGGRKDDKR